MSYLSYVALGDSFTEGLMDAYPTAAADQVPAGGDQAGGAQAGTQAGEVAASAAATSAAGNGDAAAHEVFRGWADRLAELLTTSVVGSPELRYANLAIRGRQLDQIIDEQVPRALELAPDFVTLVAGGNDILRPRADIEALAGRLERAVIVLREAGIDVMIGNGYDTQVASPLIRSMRSRVGVYNSHLWTIAQRHDCHMLDVWGLRDLYAAQMWAPDRIHLSSTGHELVAQQALATLEHAPLPSNGFRMPPRQGRPIREAVREESKWVREHLGPWVGRRIKGVSSGDLLSAKYPELVPVKGEGNHHLGGE